MNNPGSYNALFGHSTAILSALALSDTMRIETVFIDEIKVGERRREEFGDIEGLAESIGRYGLFHPIIVDSDSNLVAGERRLRACRDVLGWHEIPARLYSELTEDERREIELEENVRRKDLTPFEVSRQLVKKAEKVAPLISTAAVEIQDEPAAPVGRPSEYAAPKRDVAQALGVGTSTLVRAEQHVEAVTKYPELTVISTQKGAIEAAKKLDRMPTPERNEILSGLSANDRHALDTLQGKIPAPFGAAKPARPKPASHKYATNLSQIQVFIASVSSVGAEELVANWTEAETLAFLGDLRECLEGMGSFFADLESVVRELERRAS